jgi:hypothetical protein
MKITAVFLSFYILVLTAIPCFDAIEHASAQGVELSANTAISHQNDTDCCTPFCNCQCCQASFTVTKSITLSPVNLSGISYFEIPSKLQSLELFDFLIPPKA